jgi:hypothetical protein
MHDPRTEIWGAEDCNSGVLEDFLLTCLKKLFQFKAFFV